MLHLLLFKWTYKLLIHIPIMHCVGKLHWRSTVLTWLFTYIYLGSLLKESITNIYLEINVSEIYGAKWANSPWGNKHHCWFVVEAKSSKVSLAHVTRPAAGEIIMLDGICIGVNAAVKNLMLCIRNALECLSALQIPYPHQCCVKKGSLILSGPQILHWGLFSQEHWALLRRILCQVCTWQLASPGLVPGEDGGSGETKATFVFDA